MKIYIFNILYLPWGDILSLYFNSTKYQGYSWSLVNSNSKEMYLPVSTYQFGELINVLKVETHKIYCMFNNVLLSRLKVSKPSFSIKRITDCFSFYNRPKILSTQSKKKIYGHTQAEQRYDKTIFVWVYV